MVKIKILICISIILIVASCASAFHHPQSLSDYGAPPQDYEAKIKAQFENLLKDPESARYRFGQPIRAYRNGGLAFGGKVEWAGYLVDVQVNGKNSFGGYTGYKPYMAFFSGDQLVQVLEGNGDILLHRAE